MTLTATDNQAGAPAELTDEMKAELIAEIDALPPTEDPTPATDDAGDHQPTDSPSDGGSDQELLPQDVVITSQLSTPIAEVKATTKSALQRFREFLAPKPKDDAFSVVKGLDGKWYWHAIHTNNFKDREEEILTEKAHDNYVDRVDMGLVPMPILQGWHTPGSEHGEAELIWNNGHFVHSFGHFHDTPVGEKARKFYQKHAGELKLSHGFTTSEKDFDGKHYHDYNTFEISTLPAYAAANPYTSFEEIKAMSKGLSEDKRRYLENVVGKDKVTEIESADEQRSKALEDLRVEFKDFADVNPDKKPEATVTEKALGELYTELVGVQNESLSMVSAVLKSVRDDREANAKEIADLKAQIKADKESHLKELNEVRAVLNQPPRRASQDEDTLMTKEDKEVLKDKTPKADPLANFFGVPMKAQEN